MAKLSLELFESEGAILQVVWDREPCAAPTEDGWHWGSCGKPCHEAHRHLPGIASSGLHGLQNAEAGP